MTTTRGRALAGRLLVDAPDLLIALIVGLGVRIAFIVYTGRIWEDALITVAHAQNAAAGIGLTHHPGEGPTHGFTSALSVLVPLVGEVVVRGSGILAIQIASLIAMVVALIYAWALARRLGLSAPSRALVLLFLAVEQNHVFYGASGMETQIAVAILLGSLYHTIRGSWVAAGVGLGLAILARPDFVILAPFLLLGVATRRGVWSAVRSAVAAGIVLLPWTAFTTWYYGSPVPHTIGAKSATYSTLPRDGDLPVWVAEQLQTHAEPMLRSFMPFFADTMVVSAPIPTPIPALVAGTMYALLVVGILAAARDRAWWPLIGFLGVYGLYRTFFLPTSYYDWYVPPFTAVAVLLVARGLDRMRLPGPGPRLAAATLIGLFILPFPWVMVMERHVQALPEEGVRREVARYLADTVLPGEPVTSEWAGYIGYDTDVLLWDFPGLTSPTALEAVRSLPLDARNTPGLVAVARPTWAVLRESERDVLVAVWPEAAAAYERCATFGPGGERLVAAGLEKRSFDLRFEVFRLRPCPAQSSVGG